MFHPPPPSKNLRPPPSVSPHVRQNKNPRPPSISEPRKRRQALRGGFREGGLGDGLAPREAGALSAESESEWDAGDAGVRGWEGLVVWRLGKVFQLGALSHPFLVGRVPPTKILSTEKSWYPY